jgi:autotransporter passenger strand-loop-strand repeat protein
MRKCHVVGRTTVLNSFDPVPDDFRVARRTTGGNNFEAAGIDLRGFGHAAGENVGGTVLPTINTCGVENILAGGEADRATLNGGAENVSGKSLSPTINFGGVETVNSAALIDRRVAGLTTV